MDAPSNQRPVGDYTRNDVLFGRGGGINVHPGMFVFVFNVCSIWSLKTIDSLWFGNYNILT